MYYVCAAFQENVTLDGDDLLGDCLDQLSSVGVLHVGVFLCVASCKVMVCVVWRGQTLFAVAIVILCTCFVQQQRIWSGRE